MHTNKQANKRTHIHTYTYTRIYACVYIYTCMCTYVYVYACVCVRIYICAYIHTCIRTYVRAHAYTHTHIKIGPNAARRLHLSRSFHIIINIIIPPPTTKQTNYTNVFPSSIPQAATETNSQHVATSIANNSRGGEGSRASSPMQSYAPWYSKNPIKHTESHERMLCLCLSSHKITSPAHSLDPVTRKCTAMTLTSTTTTATTACDYEHRQNDCSACMSSWLFTATISPATTTTLHLEPGEMITLSPRRGQSQCTTGNMLVRRPSTASTSRVAASSEFSNRTCGTCLGPGSPSPCSNKLNWIS